jgi:hypothetical protein
VKIQLLAKTIFSAQTLREFSVAFIASFGIFGGIAQVIQVFWPNLLQVGLIGLLWVLALSTLCALIVSRPKLKFSRYFPVPDAVVTVIVGDLFEEKADLVIGFNDVFDTEIGEIVSAKSLQGELLTKIYQGNQVELDNDIQIALEGIIGQVDDTKTVGKNARYPLGTVAVLRRADKKYYCSAYGRMESDLTTSSSVDTLWHSLNELWGSIRLKGECETIAMPVIGTLLARIGESHPAIIKLILLSFVMASRRKIITKELRLVISPSNLGKVNLKEIENFLRYL